MCQTVNVTQLRRTKQVATQFKLFAMVFLVPGILYVITMFLKNLNVQLPGWILVSTFSLVFLAGFLNALVYFRLRYMRMRSEVPTSYRITTVYEIMHDTLFPCCCKKQESHAESSAMSENIKSDCEPDLEDFVENKHDTNDCEPELGDFVPNKCSSNDCKLESKMNLCRKGENPHELTERAPSTQSRDGNILKSLRSNLSVSGTNQIAVPAGDWKALRASGVKTINKNQITVVGGDWRTLRSSGVKTIKKNQTSSEQQDPKQLSKAESSTKVKSIETTCPVSDNLFPVKTFDFEV